MLKRNIYKSFANDDLFNDFCERTRKRVIITLIIGCHTLDQNGKINIILNQVPPIRSDRDRTELLVDHTLIPKRSERKRIRISTQNTRTI